MKRMCVLFCGPVLVLGLFTWAGCPKQQVKPTPTGGGVATATIEGRSGNSLNGTARLEQKEGKTTVHVEVNGAPPGQHGVHIHEKGDCSDPEAKSAGGHFNPMKVQHGAPDAPQHHPGDFGNMSVDEQGHGVLDLTTDAVTITDGPTAVVGRAIIIHEKPDDLVTQPTGNAGGRIGCGVIQKQ